MSANVSARFDCSHVTTVSVRVDDDVIVPEEVRGLGKCKACLDETNLVPIPGVQPRADGNLVLESIFWMPIES